MVTQIPSATEKFIVEVIVNPRINIPIKFDEAIKIPIAEMSKSPLRVVSIFEGKRIWPLLTSSILLFWIINILKKFLPERCVIPVVAEAIEIPVWPVAFVRNVVLINVQIRWKAVDRRRLNTKHILNNFPSGEPLAHSIRLVVKMSTWLSDSRSLDLILKLFHILNCI